MAEKTELVPFTYTPAPLQPNQVRVRPPLSLSSLPFPPIPSHLVPPLQKVFAFFV